MRTKKNKSRLVLITIGVFTIIFALLQIKQTHIVNPPTTGDLQAPANVKAIVRRACYDCHSNETNLRWYDKIAPISWTVATDVKDGRKLLNFSEWDKLSPADRSGKLWECLNQIKAGAMPIKKYEIVHPSAKVSESDLAVLKAYLIGKVNNKPLDSAKVADRNKQYNLLNESATTKQAPLPKTLNGIEFIPDYKNWQPISTTDRFDNGTMRVIFGNNIAIAAIKNHQINPWPNGTIFAKEAWDELADNQGNITTGAFKQIEYMIKDNVKFASTHGWGFARFKTPKLVPYGKTLMFTTECVNCHTPVSDNDYVFTQPLQH
ncbi:hypothetical protein ABIB40_000576 [Pedobacter sp. UYP30]|uniref:heme-binding domain-containing protein n=1 Tax=Pedobacter sp. UYP30 TaxID=1756400 RepID=UPI003393C4A4